ncbi:IS1182 family transposase [Pseudomonas sp. FW306-02-F02-AA]|uniref:Transposase n=1 Tax=Pseudomonas fluorescens TaxID=294 RepID=A0A0N9W0R0_PSEFL|nr:MULTISPECIES: IS1182 family transposase [Pseudomonas]ALI01260.1 transposase [Pseudomonas fluorescens]ALI02748.1 transposase [Pseudomonas fluorescens]ALI04679.1 transposase [Pseudomonas fluorescens]PMZ00434.1 IS1182 family transposase [Pseudomonas sp. FW306-02-F02-AB]PMZ06334.1 IS1182 family transposase [Pseudomonas sp. FW306-02-H06C]
MTRFIQGEHRGQSTLLPESLDDYVSDTNPVRVVDVFVDELDLAKLGFEGVIPADTGRPAYHPAILLKIYIYGYLNRIQSSRRLEREAQRNVELMWLTGRLRPDFKTIANFRKDNSKAIRGVCRQFVVLCQQLGLFEENLVAIDGSKFKAVNNRDRNFTSAKLQRRMVEIESSINRYLTALDEADQQEPSTAQPKAARLEEKIVKLKAQMKELQAIEVRLNDSPDKQVSLTDPDARSMMTRGTGIVGYNVQTAVDTQHHLIVAHEVTNTGSDRDQLSSMGKQAREAMGLETLSVVADRGYFKSEEILACHNADITAYVPKPMTSGAKADGRFNNDVFIYDATKNEYICPAGQALIWRFSSVDNGLKLHRYWSSNCQQCPLKLKCTPGRERRVRRWEHEAVLEKMQSRLSNAPEMMRIRKRTVEHPFGTLKHWMGAAHFLTRKLPGVSAEMSLNVLAYNLKRVMKIMGVGSLIKALAT